MRLATIIISLFTGLPLKVKEETFQINTVIGLKIPTSGRQTSWLFTSVFEELN